MLSSVVVIYIAIKSQVILKKIVLFQYVRVSLCDKFQCTAEKSKYFLLPMTLIYYVQEKKNQDTACSLTVMVGKVSMYYNDVEKSTNTCGKRHN